MIKDTVGLESESKKLEPNKVTLEIPCCEGKMTISHETQDLQFATDILQKMFGHVGVSIDLVTTRKGGGGP